jgi:dTDP-4-dehydrorhamnose 3,5-epimerase
MIQGAVIRKLEKNSDERGFLAEIFRHDETDFREAMGYVSLTNPGIVRGPHEHVSQSDCFVFLGPGSFELHLWDRRAGSVSEGEHFQAVVGQEIRSR